MTEQEFADVLDVSLNCVRKWRHWQWVLPDSWCPIDYSADTFSRVQGDLIGGRIRRAEEWRGYTAWPAERVRKERKRRRRRRRGR